jgi:hypothetical protein
VSRAVTVSSMFRLNFAPCLRICLTCDHLAALTVASLPPLPDPDGAAASSFLTGSARSFYVRSVWLGERRAARSRVSPRTRAGTPATIA